MYQQQKLVSNSKNRSITFEQGRKGASKLAMQDVRYLHWMFNSRQKVRLYNANKRLSRISDTVYMVYKYNIIKEGSLHLKKRERTHAVRLLSFDF